jgi:hypothetical protein
VKNVISGMAHITGSGLADNLVRSIPSNCDAVIDRHVAGAPVFKFLQKHGNIDDEEMKRVFNLGIGYCVIVKPAFAESVKEQLEKTGETVSMIGKVVRGKGTREGWDSRARERLPWAVALRPFIDGNVSSAEDPNDQFRGAAYYRDPGRPKDLHNIHFVNNGFKFNAPGKIDTDRKGPMPLTRAVFPTTTLYLNCYADDPNDADGKNYYRENATDMSIAQWYDVWAANQINGTPTQLRIAPRRHGQGGQRRVSRRARLVRQGRGPDDAGSLGRQGLPAVDGWRRADRSGLGRRGTTGPWCGEISPRAR